MNDTIRRLLRLEPVAVRALASALVGLGLALGLDLKGDIILQAVDTLLPLAAMVLTFLTARGAVTPNAKVVVSTDEIRG